MIMKKILFAILAVVGMVSCTNPEPKSFRDEFHKMIDALPESTLLYHFDAIATEFAEYDTCFGYHIVRFDSLTDDLKDLYIENFGKPDEFVLTYQERHIVRDSVISCGELIYVPNDTLAPIHLVKIEESIILN